MHVEMKPDDAWLWLWPDDAWLWLEVVRCEFFSSFIYFSEVI